MATESVVKVEAQFTKGEYNISILSASESTGLARWLTQNGYHIPEGAAALLKPYVEQGSKFFVAKVDIKEVKLDAAGKTMLSPLRVHYDSETFSLPIRLGLINAKGKQDLLVHTYPPKRSRCCARRPAASMGSGSGNDRRSFARDPPCDSPQEIASPPRRQ